MPRHALAPDRPRRHAPRVALGIALAGGFCCDRTHGEIELNWTVVDAAGASVFPTRDLDDLCGFTGRMVAEGPRARYALHVQLELCDPACGCDPACEPTRLTFDCDAARGWGTVLADEYELRVSLIARPETGCACELTPACALAPGPRVRAVEPGLVTDLQVFLFVLSGFRLGTKEKGSPLMDLDGCCVPDPSCSP